MESIAITAKSRSEFGKKANKALRKEGLVPCVMYGGSVVKHFSVTPKSVKNAIYTAEFKISKVDVDGTSHDCIIKDIQFHPVTDEILHIDFIELIDGKSVNAEIPLHPVGIAAGVIVGGKLMQLMRRVKVKSTPNSLVDALEVDVTSLELGQSVRVKDITVPEGVTVMNDGSIPVMMVEIPRALRSADAEDAENAEDVAVDAPAE